MIRVAVLVLAVALLAAPWAGHVDDTDGQLYQVLSRQMAERHSWLEPGPMPGFTAPFRDHLPFGFWPYVAAIRVAGESALPFVAGLFSLGTVALVLFAGGGNSGAAAALVLAVTESFFLYGARSRLDPPLLFFATAAAVFGLREKPRWVLAALFGAVATLIKGPFGLAPLACVAVARLSWKGVLAAAAAVVPLALFLVFADQSWRDGYLHAQLLGSATGARTDGSLQRWAALTSIAGRFWPGLPFAIYAAFKRRDRLAGATVLLLIALSLPGRKVWNHELVAYPLLAMLAGEAIGPWLDRLNAARLRIGFAALAGVGCIGAALGLGKRLLVAPCVASREFAPELKGVPAGTPIYIAPIPPEWRTLQAIAAERRFRPVLNDSKDARLALVREDVALPAPWHEVGHARGWRLLRR